MKLDAIKRSVKNAVDENGQIKNWETQLLEFEYGEFDPTSPFLVSQDSQALAYSAVEDKPIIINITTIQKIKSKHGISPSVLIHLNKQLENAVFSIDSIQYENSLLFVTELKHKNAPVIISLRKDKQMGLLTVNEVNSFYDKKNLQNLIQTTLEEGKYVYINPKKAEQFLQMNYKTNPTIERQAMKLGGFEQLESGFVKNTNQKEIIVADSLFAAHSIMDHQQINAYNYYIVPNGEIKQNILEEQFNLKEVNRIIFSDRFNINHAEIQKICMDLQNKNQSIQFGFQNHHTQPRPRLTNQTITHLR